MYPVHCIHHNTVYICNIYATFCLKPQVKKVFTFLPIPQSTLLWNLNQYPYGLGLVLLQRTTNAMSNSTVNNNYLDLSEQFIVGYFNWQPIPTG